MPQISDKCKVTIADDSMSATLYLIPPESDIAYSVDDLSAFLKAKGVYAGVLYSALEYMTQANIYNEDYKIAQGNLPTEGKDGYFEFFFDVRKNKTPNIRSDGSVDYQSMSEIRNVCVGDKLAKYHKSVQGIHGFDVRGRALRAKPCKELPALKGKGFSYNDDSGEYVSESDGRIEFDGKTLKISDVYEHRGDLDLVMGKIDFRGDVIIKGNVLAGTYIRATKTIVVEGNVEAATLISGTDMVIKKGIQGGKKAHISCGGDLYADFIEFSNVEVKGKIEANVIMNCTSNVGGDINISGKKGAIVGGNTQALGIISSSILGNEAEHKTVVGVGVPADVKEREKVLVAKMMGLKKGIDSTKREIIKVRQFPVPNETEEVRKAKISQLNRRLVRDERLVTRIEEELFEIGRKTRVSKYSKIEVSGTAYPGTQITVDGYNLLIEKEYKNARFVKDEINERIEVLY